MTFFEVLWKIKGFAYTGTLLATIALRLIFLVQNDVKWMQNDAKNLIFLSDRFLCNIYSKYNYTG